MRCVWEIKSNIEFRNEHSIIYIKKWFFNQIIVCFCTARNYLEKHKGWTTNVVAAIVLAIAVKFGGGWFMTWTFFGSVINIFQLETFNFGIKKDLVDIWPIF